MDAAEGALIVTFATASEASSVEAAWARVGARESGPFNPRRHRRCRCPKCRRTCASRSSGAVASFRVGRRRHRAVATAALIARRATMPIANADIAAAFEQTADLLELQSANPFRVRAYRNAARIVGDLKVDLAALVAGGQPLPKLPGIGADLSAKIQELAATGR